MNLNFIFNPIFLTHPPPADVAHPVPVPHVHLPSALLRGPQHHRLHLRDPPSRLPGCGVSAARLCGRAIQNGGLYIMFIYKYIFHTNIYFFHLEILLLFF